MRLEDVINVIKKEGRKEGDSKSIFLSSYSYFRCFGDTASSHERRTRLFGSSGISPCRDWDTILLWRAMISSSVSIDVIVITINSPRG